MRTIKKIHKAEFRPIDDLLTYSPLPTRSLQQIDPFIFLNHHGPQNYPKNNYGLPFGPHPHRGMETVTFIIDGDIAHKDSDGNESVIESGGIQWMTAGRGLIHAETSSQQFLKEGGPIEILQLWVNLPAKHKMTTPGYWGKQKNEIPHLELNNGQLTIQCISGTWEGQKGAFDTLNDIQLASLQMKPGSSYHIDIPASRNIFFYVVRGRVNVNNTSVELLHLVEFNNEGTSVKIETEQGAYVILGHAEPFNEPLVARGPFVMNTEQEIMQAYQDYQRGLFGTWH